jgi:predicted N-acetyltransferase YhbS
MMSQSYPSHPDGLVIRPLAPSDSIPELTQLLHRAYGRRATQGLRYMATNQSDEVTRERANSGECFVAFDDGVLVGTILFKPSPKTNGCAWYDRPEVASIGQFGVEPSIQAKGLERRTFNLNHTQRL